MLYSFLKYENSKFLKSYAFIAPVFIYILCLVGIYIYKNIPVLSSFGSTAILLFLAMTWISIINFNRDTLNERHILYVHLKTKTRYLMIKMIYQFLFSFILICLTLLYPIIVGVFDKHVTVNLLFIGIVIHIILSALGILLGAFVTNTSIANKKYTWLFTIFIIIIILTKEMIIDKMPVAQWLLWIFPPINNIMNLLNSDTLYMLNVNFILSCSYTVIYIVIAFIIINYLFKKSS